MADCVVMDEQRISDLFHYREAQEAAIEAAFNTPRPCIAIIGPPGSGKSVVNMAIAEHWPKSVILCVTKQLQKQYIDSAPFLKLVMGKNNYPCPMGYGKNAEVADDLGRCKSCAMKHSAIPTSPYWKAEYEADHANISVTNYAYYFFQRYYGEAMKNRNSIVFDEAHELDKTILGLMDIEFDRERDGAILNMEFPTDIREWKGFRGEALEELSNAVTKEEKGLRRRFEMLGLAFADTDVWLVDDEGEKVYFRPKWVDPSWTAPLISSATKVVLSSATFYPAYVGSLLGFSEEDIEVIEMPSYFNPAFRPLIFIPSAKVSTYKGTAEEELELDRLVLAIDKRLAEHNDEKGLVHTVSYALRDAILLRTRFPNRFLTHDSYSRNKVIDKFRTAPKGTVLISPSITTGVDLPYEHVVFQIIAKLPIPNLGDSRVQSRKKERKWVHDAEVANTLIQMYGRAMRSPDDFGITYVLDTWAYYFYTNHEKMFPQYVKEAVHVQYG